MNKTSPRPDEQSNLEAYYREQDKALLRAGLFIVGLVVAICVLAIRFGGK